MTLPFTLVETNGAEAAVTGYFMLWIAVQTINEHKGKACCAGFLKDFHRKQKYIIPAALITLIHFSWQLHHAPWPDINIMGNL